MKTLWEIERWLAQGSHGVALQMEGGKFKAKIFEIRNYEGPKYTGESKTLEQALGHAMYEKTTAESRRSAPALPPGFSKVDTSVGPATKPVVKDCHSCHAKQGGIHIWLHGESLCTSCFNQIAKMATLTRAHAWMANQHGVTCGNCTHSWKPGVRPVCACP